MIFNCFFSLFSFRLLKGHNKDVNLVACHQNGNTGVTLNGHYSYVTSVAFNTQGTLLASGSLDKTIKL